MKKRVSIKDVEQLISPFFDSEPEIFRTNRALRDGVMEEYENLLESVNYEMRFGGKTLNYWSKANYREVARDVAEKVNNV